MLWKTPTGDYTRLADSITHQSHVLIAGTTGSGKSVLTRAVLNRLLFCAPGNALGSAELILIDPKRTELVEYRPAPHCIKYASEPETMLSALTSAVDLCDRRYQEMQTNPAKMDDRHYYIGSDIWVVIDELADLMTTQRRLVQPLLQRLCQIGRAARIHLLACTQCPIVKVIPTEIKVNFDAIVALRTRSAQDSRNIIGMSGAEQFPKYGKCMYQCPDYTDIQVVDVLFCDSSETKRLVTWWTEQTQTDEMPTERTESPNSALNGLGHRILGKMFKGLKMGFGFMVGACAIVSMIA